MRVPLQTRAVFELPAWVEQELPDPIQVLSTVEERMQLAIHLSRLNVEHQTGGPFGAVVFTLQSHQIVAVGVNRTVPSNCSVAHAEILALIMAQQGLGSHLLSLDRLGQQGFELVSSTEPCAMCLGAIGWSGITQLVCGAREEDAQVLGFDEGEKPKGWVLNFQSKGITVLQDICRLDAVKPLMAYRDRGGPIYNGFSTY